MIRTMLTAIALVLPMAASAHSFWLQPADHTPSLGEEVTVEFKVGDVGDGDVEVIDLGLYWERIAALRLHTPDGVVDSQANVRTTDDDEIGSARLALTRPGTHILAFASNPSFSDLEAARFDRYVAHEGLTAIAADRAMRGGTSNGTELYARRAKTLFQIGETLSDHVTKPIGQTLEIVPLDNPFALKPGQPLRLRVLWRGAPLEGATLAAIALDELGQKRSFVTDGEGTAIVTAWNGEPTLFSTAWGVPAPNDARADYVTVFASLTVGR